MLWFICICSVVVSVLNSPNNKPHQTKVTFSWSLCLGILPYHSLIKSRWRLFYCSRICDNRDTNMNLAQNTLTSTNTPIFIPPGGKENDIKLWLIGEHRPIFQAKNLANDWLQLRQPVWVTDLCFLPGEGGRLVVGCSRYGYVRWVSLIYT